MSYAVYVFGAGINRGIRDWHGLSPPLANDFFQQVLRSKKYASEHYLSRTENVWRYIDQYWKLSIEELKSKPFNLEECFSLLQLQKWEAQVQGDREHFVNLSLTELQLTSLLTEFLGEFSHFGHTSDSFSELGRIILQEEPTVLTFNYDTLLEESIESASGVSDVPESFRGEPSDEISDEELAYSHMKWNRPLAYGIQFDEVQLQRAGLPAYVNGDRFYGHPDNDLYDWSILKLHGSLNWFEYSGEPRYPFLDRRSAKNKGDTVLCNATPWLNELPDIDNEILFPLIITPVLYKQMRSNDIIPRIWEKARGKLSACRRLVVGGYSFPVTDFHTRRLFLESFEERSPEEIVIINPDTSIVERVKDLAHFERPVLVCNDLDEFVRRCYRT